LIRDYIDAEAIAEAVGRPTMRFVPVKSDDQLDLQSLHRVRERWVMRRTQVSFDWLPIRKADNCQLFGSKLPFTHHDRVFH
jgi:transposase